MSWDKFSDMKESMVIPTGNYTAMATYGDVNLEGFEVLPAFYGEKSFVIKDGEVTEALVTSSLQHSLVNIFYSEGFKSYFESYTTKISTPNDNIIEFVGDETRTAYIKPGTINITLDVKTPGMDKITTLSAGKIEISAKTIYNITLDANASTATLNISFIDEAAEEYNIEINISDIALNATEPSQIAIGYQSGVELGVVESLGAGTVQTQIYSATGLQSCVLTTKSPTLISKGWPTEIDLIQGSEQDIELMKSLGLKLVNFKTNDGVVFVDFTNVVPLLEYDAEDAISTFSILSIDKYSKPASEPSVLVINSIESQMSISLPENIAYEATSVNAVIQFNGNVDAMSYEYYNNGAWHSAKITSIVKNGEEYIVSLSFDSPMIDTVNGLQIKAICGKHEEIAICKIDAPILSISIQSDGDIWATSATFIIDNVLPSTRSVNTAYVVMEYNNGTEWIAPEQAIDGNRITVKALNANTAYTFRARFNDGAPTPTESVSQDFVITTEAAIQVPNAEMDGWNIEATKKLGKGKWNGLNPTTYYAYIPNSDSWATSNAKTFNHSSSGNMNYAINAYPSVVYEDRGSSNYAAVVRSIGWNDGSGNSYEGITGNVCKERSAGKLFLGKYSFDINNKTDDYNYGIEFTSRPLNISFDYKYSSYNSDKFKVWAVVENRDGGVTKRLAYGEIAAGSDASAYTNTTFQLTYDSAYNDLKATHFYIVFSSSNQCDDVHSVEATLLDNGSLLHVIDSSYWGGSVLYIDNIQLNY